MMSPEFIVTVISAIVQLAGLVILGWMLRQNTVDQKQITAAVTQITAAVSVNVLQGRRIEQVLREMREPAA